MGETYPLEPGDSLEFGRNAQLVIDDNRYLHRRVGRFECHNGLWMVCNIGRSLYLTVIDTRTQSQALIAPGRHFALTFLPALVRFRAGRTTYELIVDGVQPSQTAEQLSDDTLDTVVFSDLPLTQTQRLLVISLAEQTLRDPASGVQIPTSAQAADRLKWTITQFNRKLDNVCAKLTKVGIPGLHGKPSSLASDRRRNLVDFAIQSGLVSADDLELLDSVETAVQAVTDPAEAPMDIAEHSAPPAVCNPREHAHGRANR